MTGVNGNCPWAGSTAPVAQRARQSAVVACAPPLRGRGQAAEDGSGIIYRELAFRNEMARTRSCG